MKLGTRESGCDDDDAEVRLEKMVAGVKVEDSAVSVEAAATVTADRSEQVVGGEGPTSGGGGGGSKPLLRADLSLLTLHVVFGAIAVAEDGDEKVDDENEEVVVAALPEVD